MTLFLQSGKPPRTDNKGKTVKYPFKEVGEIYRIRALDNSEWMKTRYMVYGFDSLGNEMNLAIMDEEMYNEVIPIYGQKPENPKDNPHLKNTKMANVFDRLGKRIQHTLRFTAEAL